MTVLGNRERREREREEKMKIEKLKNKKNIYYRIVERKKGKLF